MHETMPPIVGAWKLNSFEIRSEDGAVVEPFGASPQGMIVYDQSGRFSVQVHRSDRVAIAAGDQMKGSPEENTNSYRSYIAYYGAFDWDESRSTVTHNIEGSLFPNWEGQGQERHAELRGNELELTTAPTQWGGGGIVVASLRWTRIGA